MMSLHLFKQFIPLYPTNIVTVNMLTAVDIDYSYSDIVANL
ncbi:MAG: hypothetical protein ACTS73_05265 [Arsenophonus sp. NEOnobi-MAG3]